MVKKYQKLNAQKNSSFNKEFRANTRMIREVLKEATREDLNTIKSQWGDLLRNAEQHTNAIPICFTK